MKAHISKSRTVAVWSGALPSSYDGWFLDITETAPPRITAGEVLSEGPLEVEWTDGVPVAVVQTWTTRPKTADEAQTTLEQLTLIDRLSDDELVALEDICLLGHPERTLGLRIRASMFAAIETYSRTEKTKTLIGAAIQLGVVASVDRARELLNDSGFTLG